MANGGRAEQFLVRLPVDTIASFGTREHGVRARPHPAAAVLPADLQDEPLLLEHFKVRDTEGNVIGVAVRHTVSSGEDAATAWAVTIPSRGTLRLAGSEVTAGLDAALAGGGVVPGEPWEGDLRVTMTAAAADDAPGGRVLGGSGEFRGLGGTFSESWLITGIGEQGELRGTIELSTVTHQGP